MRATEETLAVMIRDRARSIPQMPAQLSKSPKGVFEPISYAEYFEEACTMASGLLELGIRRGDLVGLMADNRREWLVADTALLSIGAADVPRGCDSTADEIAYILGFCSCSLTFSENRKMSEKILSKKDALPALKTIVMFDAVDEDLKKHATHEGIAILHYSELLEKGKPRRAANPQEIDRAIDEGTRDDIATIIFTSGTTGEPKGVMLTHANFLHQLPSLKVILDAEPGDIWLSVLPVWHSFERLMEYVAPYLGSSIAYSKPVGSIMLADFAIVKPQWMASVPRIWEAVRDGVYRSLRQQGGIKFKLFSFFVAVGTAHAWFRNLTLGLLPNFGSRIRIVDSILGFIPWLLLSPLRALGNILVFKKIKAKLGGRFKAGISGGGALPSHVDRFFAAIGVTLLEGYGLTETAPVVAVRRMSKPRPGCVGQIILDTEVAIFDDSGKALPPGKQGVIHVRGGQVMKGYYKKPEETAKILNTEGWLNTGDLGIMTRDNEVKITGRAKDTIVLRGGENIEPAPIEQKMSESDLVSQCMVVGQDQKYLAALVVPNIEYLSSWAKENNIFYADQEALLNQPEVQELVFNEISERVSTHTGFKPFECIFRVKLLAKAFEVGVELSAKQEIMRHRVAAIYKKEIEALFTV